jgi:hypothetical protein
VYRQRQAGGRGHRALVLMQAQGQPLLDQPGERQLLSGGEGLGFRKQVVAEIEGGAHGIRANADFCIVGRVDDALPAAGGGMGKQWPDPWA